MRIRYIWMRVFLPALMLAVFTGQAVSAEAPEVFYDKAADRLSVKADTTSLKGLLARIALLTGAEFLIDPAVEQTVSITLKDMPLEKGLKRIVKALDLSYAMMYQKKEGQDEAAEPLLVTMKIVPKGMKNPNLVSVVDVKGEAVIRSFSRRPLRKGQKPSIFDYAEKRWQARLDSMTAEERKQIEEDIKRRQEEQAARMEEKEERGAEREERKAEHQAKRQAAEEELKESNPELYELRQQQREEIRQKATDELNQ